MGDVPEDDGWGMDGGSNDGGWGDGSNNGWGGGLGNADGSMDNLEAMLTECEMKSAVGSGSPPPAVASSADASNAKTDAGNVALGKGDAQPLFR